MPLLGGAEMKARAEATSKSVAVFQALIPVNVQAKHRKQLSKAWETIHLWEQPFANYLLCIKIIPPVLQTLSSVSTLLRSTFGPSDAVCSGSE